MKVVLVTHHYPPSHLGGVELIVERIARWLVGYGHQVEVICVETITPAPVDRLTGVNDIVDGVVVHRLELGLRDMPYTMEIIYRNELLGDWVRDLLNRSKPDIVDIHSCYLTSTSVIDAAKSVDLPVLLTLHDYWFLCPRMTLLRSDGSRCSGAREVAKCAWCLLTDKRRYWLSDQFLDGRLGSWVRNNMERETVVSKILGWDRLFQVLRDRRFLLPQALAGVDLIIAKSPFLKDRLVEEGVAAERIHILTSGLDVEHWRYSGKPGRERKGLQIGYLGQISPRKGVHILIEAFNRLPDSNTPPCLWIHGDLNPVPAYGQYLLKLSTGNDRIFFEGRYEYDRLEGILGGVDLVVVPSQWYETGPLVTLEAFASGTPVVATDLPNMNCQVTHEVNGLLFAPDDAADLARQLQRSMEEPDLIPRLAAGIGTVKTFEEEMEEIMRMYRVIQDSELGISHPDSSLVSQVVTS